MKLFKILTLWIFLIAVTATTVSAASDSVFVAKANFAVKWTSGDKVHDGIIMSGMGTVTDGALAVDGKKATKITPDPSSTSTVPLGIKHTSISGMNVSLNDVKYVRYYYYYDGDYNGRAKLTFPQSDFNVTSERSAMSLENVVSRRWAYLTFDIQQVLFGYIFPEGIIDKMYFYPFGDTAVAELSSGSMYLREIGLFGGKNANVIAAIAKGTLTQRYPVNFLPGRPDTQGTAPETIYAELGETITLPENTFVREGYTFKGWICTVGSKVMQPGDEYILEERSRIGGQKTAAIDFIANWVIGDGSEDQIVLPDVNRVKVAAYSNGIVDGHKYKYGSYAENVKFDGFTTARFIPDPSGEHATTHNIAIDGYTWRNMPLDLTHYKYLIIPYYYKTDRDTVDYIPRLNMLGSADDDRALSKSISFLDYDGIKTNQWALMVFAFDFENDSALSSYLKWDELTVQNQMHLYPFGYTKAATLSENDELYFADFIFLSYIPENRPVISKGIVSGDGDGMFRPNDLLTRAEAASILAKYAGFADHTDTDTGYTDIDSHWCLPYVSYLEKKGILTPSSNEQFLPESVCNAGDYLGFVTNAASGTTAANAFGSLPVAPSSDTPLSRAYAISLASTIIGGTNYTKQDAEMFLKDNTLFNDISNDQWYYPTVALSSVTSVSYISGNASKVVDTFIDKDVTQEEIEIPQEKYDEAVAYVKTLDEITDARIKEIRSTASVYKQKDGGKTVYVSNTFGSGTVNDSSEDNPVYVNSVNEISSFALSPGDVVLLRRGEVYRGNFIATAGVTYSAYGYGDKPVIIPSPENGAGSYKWTLDYEDKTTGKKIWKYYREDLADVGGINLISSDGTHLVAYKEIPNYYDGNFFVRSNPAQEFIYTEELDYDFEYVHLANKSAKGDIFTSNPDSTATGPLYLRCDSGNPGTLYPRIEFNANVHAIKAASNVTIDNLCLKYFGRHGISAGTVHNLVVTNCEIGWGGGSIQTYKDGNVTRFGNGVEIYGALMNFIIDNCYVYEIYDAGITHQISSSSSGHYYMEGVYYTNNVLINSTYNIEYFMSKNTVTTGVAPLQERYMKDVYFTNNITRGAGYGWGVQRPGNAPANVKGWTHHNLCDNQVYENNIFDRCIDLQDHTTDYLIMTGCTYESSTPYLLNNIFVQTPGRTLMYYGKSTYKCNADSGDLINTIGGDGNVVYFWPDDTEEYEDIVFWK